MRSEITPEELLNFNQRGLIPGPNENDETFLERIQKLDHFFSYPPANLDDFLTDGDWIDANATTKRLFDFTLDWVVAYYSDRNLPFFQGAATWLIDQNGVEVPIIQLKKQLSNNSLYKIYNKEEILAHEAVHAAKMAFNAPQFEEIFAYMTAKSLLRRYLGPIFQKSWESYLFLILFAGTFFLQIWNMSWWFVSLLPWLYFAFLGVRLFYLRLMLKRCLKQLNLSKALTVAFRLTDQEIFFFAKNSQEKVREYIANQRSLRWRLIKEAYNLR